MFLLSYEQKGCTNNAVKGGVYQRHGAKTLCAIKGRTKHARKGEFGCCGASSVHFDFVVGHFDHLFIYKIIYHNKHKAQESH